MLNKLGRSELFGIIKNLFLVVLGTVILAFGTAVFILPFNLVVGGVSGIALVLDALLPYEFITVDLIITVLTWVLFFIGLIVLGKDFAMKTLISTIVYPPALSAFLHLVEPNFLGGFFDLTASSYSELSIMLAAVVGGVCIGVGCAVTFIGGGSTGGVDIIAFSLCRVFKRLKSSYAIFFIDATPVVLGMFIIGDLVLSLLGILSALISAVMVDKVFLGMSRAYVAHIVTDKYEEINRGVIEVLERTTTIIDAVGGYSGDGKKMVMVSFTMAQYNSLMDIIKKNDKYAFVTISQAHEINGEGWTR
ncbi:MAG: YitT family protein [Clostridia bacterium]|nr:YitT family protein [Clostridia bacterium]